MKNDEEPRGENEALRERISRLSAAVLRISSSLDLGTVLREVVDSARALTGARYGVITTIGEAGQPLDFVTSGFTPDEHQQLAAWPDGWRLFEHFRDLPGAIRLQDLPDYVRSLGLSSDLMRSKTLQGTPIRHRGVHVGTFFLAEKEGGPEFTDEDEEVLVLFASQAATAIANARTHQDEQRARSNLEALVDTPPVGAVTDRGWARLPTTTTCSSICTAISTSRVVAAPALISTPVRTTSRNPGSVNVTSYAPGSSAVSANVPASSVEAVRSGPAAAADRTSTVTAGSTRPVVSVTVPDKTTSCAAAIPGAAITSSKAVLTDRVRLIVVPSSRSLRGRAARTNKRVVTLLRIRVACTCLLILNGCYFCEF